MRQLMAMILVLFLVGCVGSSEPRNPIDRKGSEPLWWQADTAAITSNNPWEKFLPQPEATQPKWPEAVIFPKDWKPVGATKKSVDDEDSGSIIPNDEVF